MTDTTAILRCITRCRRDRTTGTRRRAERQCIAALAETGDAAIARDCAAAARRVGVWLAERGKAA